MGWLPNRGHFGGMLTRTHQLHLLPIVRKLFAAIEAHYICACHLRGRRTAVIPRRKWEANVFVPTTEEQIDQTHPNTPWEVTEQKLLVSLLTIQLLSSFD